ARGRRPDRPERRWEPAAVAARSECLAGDRRVAVHVAGGPRSELRAPGRPARRADRRRGSREHLRGSRRRNHDERRRVVRHGGRHGGPRHGEHRRTATDDTPNRAATRPAARQRRNEARPATPQDARCNAATRSRRTTPAHARHRAHPPGPHPAHRAPTEGARSDRRSRRNEKEETKMTQLQLRLEGDTHVIVTRKFAAPPDLVYRAHIEPELMQRWMLGPPGWTMPVCI